MKDIFAERLRKCREAASLTQTEAAGLVGLKKNTYQSYELGAHRPKLAVLIDIAQFYEVSIDYLLGRTEDPTPYFKTSK